MSRMKLQDTGAYSSEFEQNNYAGGALSVGVVFSQTVVARKVLCDRNAVCGGQELCE
jgi:hypothetical protein